MKVLYTTSSLNASFPEGHDTLKNPYKRKHGVIIINTARGGLIDEKILLKELESGKVKYTALDVFEEEPYRCALLSCKENTILTPHIASSAKEARIKNGERDSGKSGEGAGFFYLTLT